MGLNVKCPVLSYFDQHWNASRNLTITLGCIVKSRKRLRVVTWGLTCIHGGGRKRVYLTFHCSRTPLRLTGRNVDFLVTYPKSVNFPALLRDRESANNYRHEIALFAECTAVLKACQETDTESMNIRHEIEKKK